MQAFKPVFLLLLAGSALQLLADEHRQYGAHEHGLGKLDIAQEGAELLIELDSPAVNIVGFEHAPKSEQAHDTLEKALARLEDGAALFLFPDAAGCRLVDADIAKPLQNYEDVKKARQAVGEHRADDPLHQGTKKYAQEDGHKPEGETHTDITAAYRFSCAYPEALDQVRIQSFESFPMTEQLQVQFITGKHRGAPLNSVLRNRPCALTGDLCL